jgi:regulator of PEP synthase PpsR (kinase-PPPase family)
MANSEEQISPAQLRQVLNQICDKLKAHESALASIGSSVTTIAREAGSYADSDRIRSEAKKVEANMRDMRAKLSEGPSYTDIVRTLKGN